MDSEGSTPDTPGVDPAPTAVTADQARPAARWVSAAGAGGPWRPPAALRAHSDSARARVHRLQLVVAALASWGANGLGALDIMETMSISIVGMVLNVTGFQLIIVSLTLSLTRIGES